MPLDPQVQAMRAQRMRENVPPLYTLSVEQARQADLASIRAGAGSPEPVAQITDRHIPGPAGDLPIRLYQPEGEGPFPALIYFFGGGWTLGTIDTSDGICRSLCNAVPCMVISIGYRLAPEHKFPAAVQDCYAATLWIATHAREINADASRLAIGGDSAGGNLTAAVTLLARDQGGPPLICQLLVYPSTDYLSDTPSLYENVDPFFFNKRSVAWYWGHYLPTPEDGKHPLASPLQAEDLRGLPPALVMTAEYDPIRDQGEQYAERLKQAGVPVELTRYEGMIHGFFAMAGTLDGGKQAIAQAADRLGKAFAHSSDSID
jgi:acetyl esterase